ncbi:hypothetical protein GBK2_26 [Geobacillus phage GBK2]|uniref:hypothetical protein n=1 Tax=Geobacillus phage GBK2 TaxID=1458842 RepID=UPI0003F1F874|nr:hypothetical protein GBK2_26 [Geobacillus phage GBK2]AHJ88624.1 hypothetical protein GBK2_26 [Geobacillus phage GBK2]
MERKYVYVEDLLKMGREMGILPLYTKKALAERWGVSKQVVQNWSMRDENFCKPIEGLVIGKGPYYPLCEVERYEKERGLKSE